jgi:hypothetical protein
MVSEFRSPSPVKPRSEGNSHTIQVIAPNSQDWIAEFHPGMRLQSVPISIINILVNVIIVVQRHHSDLGRRTKGIDQLIHCSNIQCRASPIIIVVAINYR